MHRLILSAAFGSAIALGAAVSAATSTPNGGGHTLQANGDGGLVVRVRSNDRTVECEQDGTVIVRSGETTQRITRTADGGFVVTDGDAESTYDSEAAFKGAAPQAHAAYLGAGIRNHGEAAPADLTRETGVGPGSLRRDEGEVGEFLDQVDALNALVMGEGDLTDEERARLAESARVRLERDMQRLQEREQENVREEGAEGDSPEIRQEWYRASLKALEHDLIHRIDSLRQPGGEQFESTLDDLHDRVRDTFAELHDTIDESPAKAWPQALEDARKFHKEFGAEVDKWSKQIGTTAEVMDIPRRITEMKKQLRRRLVRIRKHSSEEIENTMDDLEEQLLENYEKLEDKVRDTAPAGWPDLMAQAEKFFVQYSDELSRWAKEAGFKEAVPSPREHIDSLERDLLERVAQLRRLGGDRYESAMDKVQDSIKDLYATLRERLINEDKSHWKDVRDAGERHYGVFLDTLAIWLKRIEMGTDNARSPEENVELPPGEHMDVIGGVRVARIQDVTRRQLSLEHGLSVNEIVAKDGVLAKAGCQVYDIITELNGAPMDTRTDLRNAVAALESGKEFTVKVLRGGKERELKGTR